MAQAVASMPKLIIIVYITKVLAVTTIGMIISTIRKFKQVLS